MVAVGKERRGEESRKRRRKGNKCEKVQTIQKIKLNMSEGRREEMLSQ